MKPPPGVLNQGEEGKVCQLLKGLYGLHQAGRGWYKEMAGVFVNKLRFKKSAVDHSVFYRRTKDEHTVDVPRMRQSSVKIGDLSVNPMWF